MTDFDAIAIAAADERLDAEQGNRLWKVERAYARNQGIKVADIKPSDQARIKWLLDYHDVIDTMTDAEFAQVIDDCDWQQECDRYNETRQTLAEWCSQ